ncbi:unnamed protein product, partial [Staurois parvus]
PRTLHSLYLVSQDPAFTISGLPLPCIHYIWSPTDPAFTISGLLHYTHGKCNYFSKYKWLNTFSLQQYIAVL